MIYLSQGSNKKIVFGSFPHLGSIWLKFQLELTEASELRFDCSSSKKEKKRKEGLEAVFYTAAAPWFKLFSSCRWWMQSQGSAEK